MRQFDVSSTAVHPAAQQRTAVTIPLHFSDGFEAIGRVVTFHGLVDQAEHLLLAFGSAVDPETQDVTPGDRPLVRLHSECLTGDVFGSQRCDCGPQLREAVERLSEEGGILLYLRQEGRGIGLYSKLDAYALQDDGLDTFEANTVLGHGEDERDYAAAAQMLRSVGVDSVRLLTNNPDKAAQLAELGIAVDEIVRTGVHVTAANARYLRAKRDHTGHLIDFPAA
ncbi:GTP cyclohydrolase II [Microbacterium sulfonylureivorans]|uniref:GTP cyclohydrolase II n=1 Tax=Microbacterium sulfonylureivorans TaxID=2486854 RepID=UPI000FD87193|nr:GTP cyclohydrolase II [Microbacterium sulfonylureivorans]